MNKKHILTKGKKAKAEQLALDNRWEEAQSLYASVCKSDPMDVEAWVKLSATQFRLGRYDEAESCARRAIMLAPNLAFAQHTLATVLQHQGKLDEASTVLQDALAKSPNSPEVLANLARLWEKQGRVKDAFDLYRRALDLHPDSLYALAKRGELLEKEGRLAEAEEMIVRGLAQAPGHPVLNLAAARLDRRAGRHAEAVARLEAALNHPMSQETGMEIHLMLGQLHDRLDNTKKVLPHLIEGKRRMALVADPDGSAHARFLARVEIARAWVTDRFVASFQAELSSPDETPIFLIGFPRSGTTLLEQVLDSHPSLQTLDEKPMAEVMERAFFDMTGGGPDALSNLSDEQIASLRQVYWGETVRHCDRQAHAWLVDKLPLNIARVPLLWRVFPQARFILAVRHPCDVTLSCLMQNFGHNDAMAGFVNLERVADTYARVMGAWREYVERMPLCWQRIRYEDLITNFEVETRLLLEFLGVGWSDTVLEHTQHAQNRGIINTPSYHQVTQPIYQHAKYRWERYANEFDSLLPTLSPFIEYFGYTM
ncbi:MAG: sulfotransferase [Hydrogenophilales bacterium]|nr:sulfotransferase [Hydrogenophilales bacterium]